MKIFIFLALMALSFSACTPADMPLPTLAQLPTDVPSNDPTPTRESEISAQPTAVTENPGSGAIEPSGDGLPELAGDGFAVRVTGAISETWTSIGTARCTLEGFVISAQNTRLSFTLPTMARAGLFDLSDSVTMQNVRPDYRSPNGAPYNQAIDGVLVLDSLNLSDGGRIEGSFDFSASSGMNSVNLSGQFNLPASVASDCAG